MITIFERNVDEVSPRTYQDECKDTRLHWVHSDELFLDGATVIRFCS